MLPRSPIVFAGLLVVVLCPSVSLSWTDATRTRMVRDALKVTPPALSAILEHHRLELDRGMLAPSRREGEEVHFQHADGRKGLAAAGVEQKIEAVRRILERHGSLRRFVYEMGALAHFVADVNFPLNASDDDPREPLYRDAYSRFIETSLAKIPFVFDRDVPIELEENDLREFIMSRARQAVRGYALIGPAFNDDGSPSSASALDERSLPFGIASLSYSRATTDIARIWRYVWGSVDGDLEGTPFMDPPTDGDDAPAARVDRKNSGS